ncbi:MAG TPA: lipid IV(A) 3-deoxy-D-manno-octulosonic acid transferase [Casimicrobiaceae bacterium]|nr:lipid IV(A) 3-deoxy-D-manno-octulosonic acid transferase [Casimicrobiaceae bacterium]
MNSALTPDPSPAGRGEVRGSFSDSAARGLYTALAFAAVPFLPMKLWWRGRREAGYRQAIGERFGRYATSAVPAPLYWVHAVSVGETRAALPLVQRLKSAHPEATILLTHMTAAGREAGRMLLGDAVTQAWLPYDLPFAVRAFFAHFHPVAGFLLETELWPNLIARASALRVPLFLINARLSERSARGYARFPALTRPMLRRLTGVAAQSADDARRLEGLGAAAPAVTGNLKFDLSVPDTARTLAGEFRLRFGAATRPVWIAASTRDGEEALIFDAMARASLPARALTLIVPRHPQRFDVVADILQRRGIPFVRRSSNAAVPADVSVVLGDSMGEMLAYYAAADVAFVGGSLLPFGAHTLIEPLSVGTPVLIGRHTFNFAEATQNALSAGAAIRVEDADALIANVARLLGDAAARAAMALAARTFHEAHRGASDRLWAWLAPQLSVLRSASSDYKQGSSRPDHG